MVREPSPPRQWLGSESWVTNPDMLKFKLFTGALGFGIQRSIIPGLREFLLDFSPSKMSTSPALTEFWENSFDCLLNKCEKIMFTSCKCILFKEVLFIVFGFRGLLFQDCANAYSMLILSVACYVVIITL